MIPERSPEIPPPFSSDETAALARELVTILRASGQRRNRATLEAWKDAAGWMFHQAGIVWHQYLILEETLDAFRVAGGSGDPHPGFDSHLAYIAEGNSPMVRAQWCYEVALALAPHHTETHYNLGTLEQRTGEFASALDRFETVARAGPSADGQPQAHLIANAHWRAAEILLAQGQEVEAVQRFDLALQKLDNFGPDHAMYARLIRRLGRVEEAAAHFERTMPYSHRYAPEFILPILNERCRLPPDVTGCPADPFDVTEVGRMTDGARILFHGGLYFRLPAGRLEIPTPAGLRAEAGRRSLRERLLGLRRNHITCSSERIAPESSA